MLQDRPREAKAKASAPPAVSKTRAKGSQRLLIKPVL